MSRPTTELTSIAAEQAVLCAILADASALAAVTSLRPTDFANRGHGLIFAAARDLDMRGILPDLVTLGNALQKAGKLDDVGGAAYLAELATESAGAGNVAAYAAIVRDTALRRRALQKLAEARDAILQGSGSVIDAIGDLAATIEGLTTETESRPQTMAEVVDAAIDAADAAYERKRSGGAVGAPSGLPTLDNRLGGLHGPRLIIPAGRPGVGKTALMNQWAMHAAARGYRVGICSLEMSDAETGLRAMATRLGLNSAALARGNAAEYARLKTALPSDELRNLIDLPIFFDFDSFSLGAVVARIAQWRRTERIDFAVIDHIGLIEAEGFKSRVEQLGAISRTLKKFAKRLQIPIVAVSQLNRAVETDKRTPKLSDLRDSGNLEQDADVVIMLHADGDPDPNGRVQVEIGLLKLRDGVRGWLPCSFEFDGRTQRFREIDKRAENEAREFVKERPSRLRTIADRQT
ncbi:MAG: hypothetical protein HYX63_01705 [Gammaproteobacteria bacterium]|nr:hypothetical protein [Gammaproteobacteria bacterium]